MKTKLKKFIISDRFCGILLALCLCIFITVFFLERGSLFRRLLDTCCWLFLFFAAQIKWVMVTREKLEAIRLSQQLETLLIKYQNKGDIVKEISGYNIAICGIEFKDTGMRVEWIEPNKGFGSITIYPCGKTEGEYSIDNEQMSDGFVAAVLLSLNKYQRKK